MPKLKAILCSAFALAIGFILVASEVSSAAPAKSCDTLFNKRLGQLDERIDLQNLRLSSLNESLVTIEKRIAELGREKRELVTRAPIREILQDFLFDEGRALQKLVNDRAHVTRQIRDESRARKAYNTSINSLELAIDDSMVLFMRERFGITDEYVGLASLIEFQKVALQRVESFIKALKNSRNGAVAVGSLEAIRAYLSIFHHESASNLNATTALAHWILFNSPADKATKEQLAASEAVAQYLQRRNNIEANDLKNLTLSAPDSFYVSKAIDFSITAVDPSSTNDALGVINLVRLSIYAASATGDIRGANATRAALIADGKRLQSQIDEYLCRTEEICSLP